MALLFARMEEAVEIALVRNKTPTLHPKQK
jgi:hypothetical protein